MQRCPNADIRVSATGLRASNIQLMGEPVDWLWLARLPSCAERASAAARPDLEHLLLPSKVESLQNGCGSETRVTEQASRKV
jgi:hypothetical protein